MLCTNIGNQKDMNVMMNKSFGNLMNKALFLLSLFTFGSSISAMETNKPNPGDVAIKNHPNAWLATKVAGGATGSLVGLTGMAAFMAFGDMLGSVISRGGASTPKRFERLKLLAVGIPVAYAGWKGGEAVTKAAWYPAWNAADKIKKFKDLINK